ncbi:hypothetical protein IQ07DRAFT_313918 [Pyrenochaeta sp. DS3sAY3a]|nr:hypothetical protein IQ07DRAFT_313918 [Pyrenochaeta sp. DS3sAY3a]
MSSARHEASDARSRLVELFDGNAILGLTTEDAAQLGAPSAPKRYALPTGWEQNKERIRQLYLNENQTLKTVMLIMSRDYKHNGSEKQYKNKLKEWGFDTKYKRHPKSENRKSRRNPRRSDRADRSIAAPPPAEHGSQSLYIQRSDNQQFQFAGGAHADDYNFPPGFAENVNSLVIGALEAGDGGDQFFQPDDLGNADYGYFQASGAQNTTSYPIRAADTRPALDHTFQVTDAFLAPDTEDVENEDIQSSDLGVSSTPNIAPLASADRGSNCWLLSPRRRSFDPILAVGVRSGRSATPQISIPERIFSLAQRHVETSFTYGIWKVDSSNKCVSLECTEEDAELHEAYFDLIRSAVLLFDQGSAPEAGRMVSKAFDLVKPIIKSRNVRALNFFWTSLVFLIQLGHTRMVGMLIWYIFKQAKIWLPYEHPVVQMFKLLSQIDPAGLECLETLHTTWQMTADTFKKQLPKLHPEYVRHQCDLIFRVYGTKDAVTAERRLRELFTDCEEEAETPQLSRMTTLNALGYNYMNSKDWQQAVDTGLELEKRARDAKDMDLLVYQIGGMEIQARAFNEMKLFRPAVACLERATPLIAEQWGNDDPWRIELMVLQQKWLRENGEIKAADNLKADISSIAERISTD